MTKKIIILAFGLALTTSAHADVCFQDLVSLQVVASQLPITLQKYPLYLVHSSFTMTGALRIIPNGSNLELEAHVQPIIGDVINDDELVTEACLSGNELKVTLSEGKSDTLTVNASSFTIQGFQFEITDEATYDKIASEIPPN